MSWEPFLRIASVAHDTVTEIIPGPATRYLQQTRISGNCGGPTFIPPTRFGADPDVARLVLAGALGMPCFHVDAVINKSSSAQMGWTNVFEDLAGQVAVVTGGARGLGLSMAQALARWRVKIALLDVLADVSGSAEMVQREFDVESLGISADVTDDRSVAAGFAEVSRTLGSPSILINAAGITVWEDSIDASKESWQRVIDVNLTGTFLCCQALARACNAAGDGGVILNVSSMSAQIVNVPQHQASYNVSKAGVDMLTKSLAWSGRR
jgi:NADP-dependent 3-hydroxy acid dehydrogenase YdfG